MKAFCDVAANGETWTVIQRRRDVGTKFDLGWEDYKRGFGSPSGNTLITGKLDLVHLQILLKPGNSNLVYFQLTY